MGYNVIINDVEVCDSITFDDINIGERVFCVTHGDEKYFYKIDTLKKMKEKFKILRDPITNLEFTADVLKLIHREISLKTLFDNLCCLVDENVNNDSYVVKYLKYIQNNKKITEYKIELTLLKDIQPPLDLKSVNEILGVFSTEIENNLKNLVELQKRDYLTSRVQINIKKDFYKNVACMVPQHFFYVYLVNAFEKLNETKIKTFVVQSVYRPILFDLETLQDFFDNLKQIKFLNLHNIYWKGTLDLQLCNIEIVEFTVWGQEQKILFPSKLSKIFMESKVSNYKVSLPQVCDQIQLVSILPDRLPSKCDAMNLTNCYINSTIFAQIIDEERRFNRVNFINCDLELVEQSDYTIKRYNDKISLIRKKWCLSIF